MSGEVAVISLMDVLEVQKVQWGGHGGGRPLKLTKKCGLVVGLGEYGPLTYIKTLFCTVMLGQNSCELQVQFSYAPSLGFLKDTRFLVMLVVKWSRQTTGWDALTWV